MQTCMENIRQGILKRSIYRAQNEAVDGVMAGFWGKCF